MLTKLITTILLATLFLLPTTALAAKDKPTGELRLALYTAEGQRVLNAAVIWTIYRNTGTPRKPAWKRVKILKRHSPTTTLPVADYKVNANYKGKGATREVKIWKDQQHTVDLKLRK